jgi:thiamine pyrophosphate-dependent acetolactate synthase large subunit-like protein
MLRGYQLAVEPPSAPILIMTDSELQEKEIEHPQRPVPRLNRPRPPVGDSGALAEAARMLVGAKNPVIVVDKLVSGPTGMQHLIALAETLQAPVIDKHGRMNMPNMHYLNQTLRGRSVIAHADVILGLELTDPWGTVNTLADVVERYSHPVVSKNVKLISIGTHSLLVKSNFQNFQRYQPIDLDIVGDGEATLPYLIEAVKQALPTVSKVSFDDRAEQLKRAFKNTHRQALAAAAYGWDATPISTARMCAEIWPLIKDSDWAVSTGSLGFIGSWPLKLWDFTKTYQFDGGSGGAGVGYDAPATVGAALAHREHGRLVVGIWGDGNLMCAPGSLWTAAHHKIPLLAIVHNNRAYHQELMHVQRICNRHQRGIDRAEIGTVIDDPAIDYAKLAQSLGVEGIGPVTDPNDLGKAYKRAVDIVKRGEPVLVDVVAQGR